MTAKKSPILTGFQAFIRITLGILLFGASLFVPAGGFNWLGAWLYLGIWVVSLTFLLTFMFKKNPDLIEARRRRHKNTKKLDKIILALYSPMPLVIMVIAGLDQRFGWTDVSMFWIFMSLAGMLLAFIPAAWAMFINPHFEATVRIQEDRGHRVISSGPYGFVRHPGYIGIILIFLFTPLILESLWAFIPAGFTILLFIIRTAFEDRTLINELDGYSDYAQKVRYRLIPGIW